MGRLTGLAFFLSMWIGININHSALFSEEDYTNSLYLDENEIVLFAYSILNDTHIQIGIQCNNPGWCSIGISPNGQMPNSDIMFFWVDDSDSTVYLQDRWAASRTYPTLDNEQSLTLISGSQENDVTYIRFIRKIYACDDTSEDSSFATGTSRMLWAFNANDPSKINWDSSNGVTWHGSSGAGMRSVNVLAYTNTDSEIQNDTSYYDLRMPSNIVANDSDTSYYCGLVKLPHFNETQHIIAIEPLIKEGKSTICVNFITPSSIPT